MGARASFKGGFNPGRLSAVTAWLRLAQGTVTGSGYSSVPDVLNSNPAVQGTDARRPVAGVSANGLPIATFSDDLLSWPLDDATNNQSPAWGLGIWLRCTPDGLPRRIWSIRSTNGSSASRIEISHDTNGGRGLHCDVYRTATDGRRGALLAPLPTNTWTLLTVEYDGGKATEAERCIFTLGGVPLTLSFSTLNTDTEMPTALAQPTGQALIGAQTSTPAFQYVGDVGPNTYSFSRQLTASERAALLSFEAPT